MIKKLLIIAFIFSQISTAYADWPVGKGRTTLLPGYTYFHSASSYNKAGSIIKFPEGNRFITQIGTFSLQHGLGRSVDLIATIPFIYQQSINKDSIKTASGVGDISIGIAKHFSSPDQHRHVTVKALFMIPLYTKDAGLALGYGSRAFNVEANYSFAAGKKGFAIIQGAYTNFFDNIDGPQQYTYTGTYGRKLSTFAIATVSFMHQESYSPNTNFNPNLSANTSFTNGRVTLSYGRRITRTILPMLQVSSVVYGKNAGGGFGLGLSLITRLP